MAKTYTNERDVKQTVKKLLDKHNWFWWMPPANGFGKAGIADFNAVRGGVFLAVETKFGKNKPTAMQVGFLKAVQSESCFAFVVNEESIAWFQSWLEAFDRSIEAASKNAQPTVEDGAMMINAIREMTKEIP